jgi:glyoxylase-like metal-dependent hydrolase (beta-lactamase superfamily II)
MRTVRAAAIVLAVTLATAVAVGQDDARQTSGIDITGSWYNAGGAGGDGMPILAEYGGLPISESGRLYALTWSPARMTVRQQQCAAYDPSRQLHGGGNYRYWEERDPVTQRLVAIRIYGQITEAHRTIWMDGRTHPPAYAKHTWLGFSTGRYEGSVLTVYTTHLKRAWLRPNGVPQSDQATLVEHFVRHGDRITYMTVLTDPVYLAEPYVRSTNQFRSVRQPDAWLYACDDGEQVVGRRDDEIPNYLFGQNPYLREYADKHRIPLVASLGGADTMYPEYRDRLAAATDADALARTRPLATGPAIASRAIDPDPRDGEIHVWPVQGNVYLLIGDGGNIAVQVGEHGALVVDTGTGTLAAKVVTAIKTLVGDKPIQYVVNTNARAEHTGGNVAVREAGSDPSLVGSFFSAGAQSFGDAGVGATIIAHNNVLTRMSAPTGQVAPTPAAGWPSDTFLQGRRRKHYNDEAVEIFWAANAVTDGDSFVHFRRSDVIVTGDLFTTTHYPVIDIENGGSVHGLIDALNAILDRTVYKHQEEGGTLIVPGHGRICDEYEVGEYRDMIAIVRDRVQAMIGQGATVDQVKAARVTADFDARCGAVTGPWTTDMFVEAVYASLRQGRPRAGASR